METNQKITVTQSFGLLKGDKGDPGPQGDPFTYEDFTPEQLAALTGPAGVGIESIEQTSISGWDDGDNVLTVKLTDGRTATFTVQNGSKGSRGVGVSHINTDTTKLDGGRNTMTVVLTDGQETPFYVYNGSKGTPGDNGYTPVRGTDYWTAADIAEIKGYVDDAILGGAW